MEKINFEAGTQVSPAKVTIDNVEHEVTPSVWEGNTPLSPFVLNKMQSNIENAISESGVIVSATEPTGANREKVWLQHSESLFDKTTSTKNQYIDDSGNYGSSTVSNLSDYIPIVSNTTYIVKGYSTTSSTKRIAFFTENKTIIRVKTLLNNTDIKISFTTPSNAKYVRLQYLADDEDNLTIDVEPKMYVLNDNNVYEEFAQKEQIEKVTQNLTLNTTYANGGTANYIKSNNTVQAYIRLDLKAVSKPASYINIASGLLFKPLTELRIYANLLNNIEVLSSNEALVQIKTNGDIYLKTTASYANNSLVIITFTYITGD